MKICILSSFEDSMQKRSGASVRIYNLAKNLAANGNDVQVIVPGRQNSSEFVEGVSVLGFRGFSPRIVLELLTKFVDIGRPTSLYFYDFLFILQISDLVREADIVQIEQQSSGGLLIPFIRRVLRKPVVVDCHDVFQALRIKHTSIPRRILETFLEKLAYKNADLILTVSKAEKERLASVVNSYNIEVISNGVDTNFFQKSTGLNSIRELYGLGSCRIVVFVGNLDYPPNREAVNALSSIARRVLHEVENVKFLVVGKTRVKLQSSNLIFTGFVDNVSDVLCISDVAVAPLFHGSGTRLKILEYFSCSLPVVSTSIAAEGLDFQDGVSIYIEDDLERFASRIIELLGNKNLSLAMGKAGREIAATTYDWKNITKKLESCFFQVLSKRYREA